MGGKKPPASAVTPVQCRARLKTCCWYVAVSLPLVLALLVYNARFILDEYLAYYGYGEAPDYELPPGVMDAFRYYDQDGDGYLDPYEFTPLGLMVREEVRERRSRERMSEG